MPRPRTQFLPGHEAWKQLKRLVRKGPAHVAVAWWSGSMSKTLPLAKGSVLVVRADKKSVSSGETNPHDLEVLARRGVRVHHHPDLHAKVFVVADQAIVGSTNVSATSHDGGIAEAALGTNVPGAVRAAKRAVADWALTPPLTRDELRQLQRLYKPPRWHHLAGTRRTGTKRRASDHGIDAIRVLRTRERAWEPHSDECFERELPQAKRQAALDHEEVFGIEWYDDNTRFLQQRLLYMEVMTDASGVDWVRRPARLRRVARAKRGRPELVLFLSLVPARRYRLRTVLRRLGPNTKLAKRMRKIRTGSIRDPEAIRTLLELWR